MKPRCLRTLSLLGGIWLAGSGAAMALPEPGYELGTIQVIGGNPVKDVPEGVILDRRFGPACDLPATPVKALAADLASSVSLDVTLIGCPAGDPPPPPEVGCEVRVHGLERVQRLEFEGWTGSLPLDLPEQTGVFVLDLRCSVSGAELDTFRAPLYMTYQTPLTVVSPPQETWYLRASTWGAGLRADATEDEVASTILQSLYSYGQRHWTYGYCLQDGDQCTIKGLTVPTTTTGIDCIQSLCGCDWQSMVEADTPCYFSDCFVFSDTLQYISAVMGVGGFEPFEVFGHEKQGFATNAWIRSLDPAFPGNLRCGPDDLACSYLFYNHMMRKRGCGKDGGPGCKIFDSTFGRIYQDIGELIDMNALDFGFDVTFPLAKGCFTGIGYGQWTFYTELERPTSTGAPLICSTEAVNPPVVFTDRPPSVAIGPDRTLDVSVEVKALADGNYLLRGALYDGGRLLSIRPSFRRLGPASVPFSGVKDVVQEVTISLSGEDLLLESNVGKYLLVAGLLSQDLLVARMQAFTSLPAGALGERPVRLLPEGSQTRISRESLRLELPIQVQQPGDYLVEARLWSGSSTLAYWSSPLSFTERASRTIIPIDFPAAKIAARGIDGRYMATIVLHNANPLYPIDSVTIEVGRFEASAFAAKP